MLRIYFATTGEETLPLLATSFCQIWQIRNFLRRLLPRFSGEMMLPLLEMARGPFRRLRWHPKWDIMTPVLYLIFEIKSVCIPNLESILLLMLYVKHRPSTKWTPRSFLTTMNESFRVYILLLNFEPKYTLIFEHIPGLFNFHFFERVPFLPLVAELSSRIGIKTFEQICRKVAPLISEHPGDGLFCLRPRLNLGVQYPAS